MVDDGILLKMLLTKKEKREQKVLKVQQKKNERIIISFATREMKLN